MAKKLKELNTETELTGLKTEVQQGTIIVGGERVLKLLRVKGLKKVYLAQNCPARLRSDVEHHAKLAGVPVVQLEQTNEELGVFCKKNFFVSVLGTQGA